jgi:hypothetical protein
VKGYAVSVAERVHYNNVSVNFSLNG